MSSSDAGAEMMTFLAPAVRCLAASLRFVKKPGRLEHDVDAEVAPSEVRGVALLHDLDRLAVDDEAVVVELDRARVRPEDRVVAQQVRQRGVVREVVDGDPLDVGVSRLCGAEHVTADAAEAVDSNAYGHTWYVLPRGFELAASAGEVLPTSLWEREIYSVSRAHARAALRRCAAPHARAVPALALRAVMPAPDDPQPETATSVRNVGVGRVAERVGRRRSGLRDRRPVPVRVAGHAASACSIPQPPSTSLRIERSKLAGLELSVQMSLRLRTAPTGARLQAWERIAGELAGRGIETDPVTLHGLGFALVLDDELQGRAGSSRPLTRLPAVAAGPGCPPGSRLGRRATPAERPRRGPASAGSRRARRRGRRARRRAPAAGGRR